MYTESSRGYYVLARNPELTFGRDAETREFCHYYLGKYAEDTALFTYDISNNLFAFGRSHPVFANQVELDPPSLDSVRNKSIIAEKENLNIIIICSTENNWAHIYAEDAGTLAMLGLVK